ncbi:unnamed protein product [Vicia faba]|uniref:Uncharacterized protein n=1 Tax=Vicia faba TaxID=3906 RepID=A0AAV0YU44_VICFA|nr:unnamed protein product [Vicia faba]
MKNHKARPLGTTPFPEVNIERHNHYVQNHGRGHVCGRDRGPVCAHNYARDINFDHSRNDNHKNASFHQKWKDTEKNEKDGHPDYGNMDVTHLEIGDFFVDLDGKIDHLIGDGTVKK